MSEDVKPKIELKPTNGVVDYATEYKKVINSESELIESAKYFVRMRKSHLTEILDTWDEVIDEMDVDLAGIVLNEFLSPKFSLLEFEFKNLTKAGREPSPESSVDEDTISEMWQKHILGRVITNQENISAISIPANSKSMFDHNDSDAKKEESTAADNKEDGDDTVADKKNDIEIFLIYKRIKWFIRNVDVDKMSVSKRKRDQIKYGVRQFTRSFSITWKVVNCLVYMDIIESVRSDPANTIAVIFGRASKMMTEEKLDVVTQDTADLLKCAHLFIIKYRNAYDEDALLRCGFGYLSTKLQILKTRQENASSVLNVASCLSDEEVKITEVYDLLKEVYDFSACKF